MITEKSTLNHQWELFKEEEFTIANMPHDTNQIIVVRSTKKWIEKGIPDWSIKNITHTETFEI